jgi:hypothetical protein
MPKGCFPDHDRQRGPVRNRPQQNGKLFLDKHVKQNPHWPFLAGVFGYMIKYTSFYLLTLVVLLLFWPLMGAYVNIFGPEMPFLRHITFMLPNGGEIITEREIMWLYMAIVTALFLSSIIGRSVVYVLKRQTKPPEADYIADEAEAVSPAQVAYLRIKRRLITNIIIASVSYGLFSVTLPFGQIHEDSSLLSFYPIIVFLYLFTLAMIAGYLVIDTISNKLISWAASHILRDKR